MRQATSGNSTARSPVCQIVDYDIRYMGELVPGGMGGTGRLAMGLAGAHFVHHHPRMTSKQKYQPVYSATLHEFQALTTDAQSA